MMTREASEWWRRARRGRVTPWLGWFVFFALMLVASREPPWGDAQVSYDTARAMVDRADLSISTEIPAYFYTVHDGRRYGPGTLGNAVAHVPSYLAYTALAHVPGLPSAPLFALTSHLSSAVLMALAAVLFCQLAQRMGAGERLATVLTLVFAFGTIALVYGRSPYSEALQTCALAYFVRRVFDAGDAATDGRLAGVGIAGGLLMTSKLVLVLVLPIGMAYVATRGRHDLRGRRGRAAAAVGAGFLPFLLLALLHNVVKTGSMLHTGYDPVRDSFTGDLYAGLVGLLVSPGKGLFWYSPPLTLALCGLAAAWRTRRDETLLLGATIGVVLVVHAKYLIWHGGYSWGPRYAVPLTPLVLLLAVPWLTHALEGARARAVRLVVTALFVWGVTVQLLGAAFYPDHFVRMLVAVQQQDGGDRWSSDFLPLGYYVPQFSPIEGHWWLLRHYATQDSRLERDAPWALLVTKPFLLSAQWARVRLDWWGLDWLGEPGASRAAGLLLFAVFSAATAVTGSRVRRALAASAAAGPGERLPQTRRE